MNLEGIGIAGMSVSVCECVSERERGDDDGGVTSTRYTGFRTQVVIATLCEWQQGILAVSCSYCRDPIFSCPFPSSWGKSFLRQHFAYDCKSL